MRVTAAINTEHLKGVSLSWNRRRSSGPTGALPRTVLMREACEVSDVIKRRCASLLAQRRSRRYRTMDAVSEPPSGFTTRTATDAPLGKRLLSPAPFRISLVSLFRFTVGHGVASEPM